MTITRRSLIKRTSALAVTAFALTSITPPLANAQGVDETLLLQAGPLGDVSLGSEDAPVTVVEYASMTCSHCASFHNNTFKAFKEKYIDTGKVRFIFREFPLDNTAAAASMLARCAPKDKYFDVTGLMFEEQKKWAFTSDPYGALINLGKQIGFTEKQVKDCLSDQTILNGIVSVRDVAANKLGVQSTPTFFINGERVPGALSLEELSEHVDKDL
ncbi:DsbA family protein [Flexibacterium corallicola]|uniref:DsbA family protein n=1 Tax=Flexibacterium corallicola TaxID=3037259 RepID=UPI00286EC8BF|nr:DsbA family protein [Pseudovibrio sp. M1P-2-3]